MTRGQAMFEYSAVSALVLVGAAAGWPFLVMLMDALSIYFQSIYYIVLSPVP